MIGAGSRAGNEADGAHQRVRLCAVSRAHKPPDELIRFVAAPDGTIVPDLACRLPGRGVWIDATAAAVARAVRQQAFARSLKRAVNVPPDLPQQIERLLLRRVAAALGMANKAGLVVAGFVKVAQRLREGRVFLLLHAAEASDAEAARLDRLFKALARGDGGSEPARRIVRELGSAELSLAMGRPTVVHAAAAGGGASERLLAEACRLRRYRLGDAASPLGEEPEKRAGDAPAPAGVRGGGAAGEDGPHVRRPDDPNRDGGGCD